MKKRKAWKWVKWIGISLICLSLLGFWAWNYSVNYVMKTMIREWEQQLADWPDLLETPVNEGDGPIHEVSSGGAFLSGEEPPVTPLPTEGNSSTVDSTPSRPNGSKTPSSAGGSDPSPDSSATPPTNQEGAQQPSGSSEGKQDVSEYSPNISIDHAKNAEQSMTMGEKAKITGILLSRFSINDLKQLMDASMGKGGISVEDKKASKALFLEKLTEDEYNELIAIAAKYGMSKGRDYQTSLQNEQNKQKE